MEKKDKTTLDAFHYHEVLHTLHIMMCNLNDHIIEHPVLDEEKEVKKEVDEALSHLFNAYQLIGNK